MLFPQAEHHHEQPAALESVWETGGGHDAHRALMVTMVCAEIFMLFFFLKLREKYIFGVLAAQFFGCFPG